MLNNTVDNLEQCGQQNIVQCCFHQARTGCAFLPYNRISDVSVGVGGDDYSKIKN